MMTKAINDENFSWREGLLESKEGVYLLPANLDLSAMEMNLVSTMNRERVLKGYVDKVKKNFDFVIIDCMPSLGMITVNALSAADSVIIPVQSHYLPAKGMEQLGYDEVNLNLGCPSGTVVARNRGAGFLGTPRELEDFLDEIFEKCPLEISIKTRIGMDYMDEWAQLLKIYQKYFILQR